jgi:hypothetical protein
MVRRRLDLSDGRRPADCSAMPAEPAPNRRVVVVMTIAFLSGRGRA